MKAILKFNLPEENEEFEMTRKAIDYHCALSEFSNRLRAIVKYGREEFPTEKEVVTVEKIRALFFSVLEEYDVDV